RPPSPPYPPTPQLTFDLDEVTLADLQAGFASGRWTSAQVTQLYLDRIAAMDRQGPALRSLLDINPDAAADAAARDAERRAAGRALGPLHGVPVIVKDNCDTHDKMTTTAGSLALAGSVAPRDSTVVARLRAAGAIILGKANLSEWANFRGDHSTSGWSSRGGAVKNPYVLDRNPCGSSSGTGAAISANFAAVGIGTETDGSIVCPSNNCGLVGVKPTIGMVSRAGIIPISASQDTAGPMTRTVTDAALLLAAIQGADPRDPSTPVARGAALLDTAAYLRPDTLRGGRVGVVRKSLTGYDAKTDAVFEAALEVLKGLGAVVIDPADIPHIDDYGRDESTVLHYEFKAGINAYLASLGPSAPMKTLEDLIRFNEAHKDTVLKWFGQEDFLKAQACGPLTDKKYLDARARCVRLSRKEGFDKVVAQHRLDVLVAPTGGPAWTTDLVNGDHFGGSSSSPCAVAGYPHVTVPMGYVSGLPVGLSFMGLPFTETRLLGYAFAYEQATKHRRAPGFLPTIGDDA
ncbi:MAG TPA: amidase, partial [Gemmatimonadales bacterium]|nr:amidase [Gemmatimonadales bacterium]